MSCQSRRRRFDFSRWAADVLANAGKRCSCAAILRALEVAIADAEAAQEFGWAIVMRYHHDRFVDYYQALSEQGKEDVHASF